MALWILGSASAAALVLISVAPVPFSMRSIRHKTGGQGVVDTAFAYSVEEGVAALHRLGETGRGTYSSYLAFDAVFACCYGAFLAGATFKLLQRSRLAAALATIPLATAAFDMVEGIGIAVSLSTFPDVPSAALVTASASGAAKHIGFWSSLGVVTGALISARRARERRAAT